MSRSINSNFLSFRDKIVKPVCLSTLIGFGMHSVALAGQIFTESFANGPSNIWPTSSANFQVTNGTLNGSGYDAWYMTNQSASDFTYEADLKADGSARHAFPILRFRSTPDGRSGYALVMDTNVIKFYKFAPYYMPIREVAHRFDQQWHRVRVEAVGSHFKIYKDGSLVLEADDSSFSNGNFGVGNFGVAAFGGSQIDNLYASTDIGPRIDTNNDLSSRPQPVFRLSDNASPTIYGEDVKRSQRSSGETLRNNINAAISRGARSFTIPRGVYRINVGNGWALYKSNLSNFSLVASEGTEVILEGNDPQGLLYCNNCTNFKVLGDLTLDADPVHYTQGIVQSYNPSTHMVVIRAQDGYRLPIEITAGAPFRRVMLYTADGKKTRHRQLWACRPSIDQSTRSISFKLSLSQCQDWFETDTEFTSLVNDMRGGVIAFQHDSKAFYFAGGSGTEIRNVKNYSSDLLVFHDRTSGDNLIYNSKSARRPNTNRVQGGSGNYSMLTGGTLVLDSNEFGHYIDDTSINFNQTGKLTTLTPDRRTATFRPTRDTFPVEVGDSLTAYRANNAASTGSVVKVISISTQEGVTQYTFDNALSANLGDTIVNQTKAPSRIDILNNYFHDNGSNGLSALIGDNITIRDNTFERIAGHGIGLGFAGIWGFGRQINNLSITNNEFFNTPHTIDHRDNAHQGVAAINLVPELAELNSPTNAPDFFKDVKISGNLIVNPLYDSAIAVIGTKKLEVSNNRVARKGATQGLGWWPNRQIANYFGNEKPNTAFFLRNNQTDSFGVMGNQLMDDARVHSAMFNDSASTWQQFNYSSSHPQRYPDGRGGIVSSPPVFTTDTRLSSGTFTVAVSSTSLCVAHASNNGAGQSSCAQSDNNQKWSFARNPEGYYQIRNRATDSCLAVASITSQLGSSLVQSACNADLVAQQWELARDSATGTYRISARSSGWVWGAPSGNAITLSEWVRNPYQQFRLTAAN